MKRTLLLFSLVLLMCAQAVLAKDPAAATYFQFVDASDALFEERVEVRWSRVPFDTVTYRILRDGSLLSVASSRDSLYSDFSGDPGVIYEYCVVMTDSTNPAVSETLCDNGSRIIFPPQDVSASDGLFEDKVRITWTDYSFIEQGYRVRRDGTPIGTTPANTEAFDDTGAVVNVIYTYEITAFDADGHYSQ